MISLLNYRLNPSKNPTFSWRISEVVEPAFLPSDEIGFLDVDPITCHGAVFDPDFLYFKGRTNWLHHRENSPEHSDVKMEPEYIIYKYIPGKPFVPYL